MLAPQTLKELSVILREEFGANLTDVEVFEVGTTLVDLFTNLHEMERKDKQDQKGEEKKQNEYENNRKHKAIPERN